MPSCLAYTQPVQQDDATEMPTQEAVAVIVMQVKFSSSMSATELQSDTEFIGTMKIIGAKLLGLASADQELVSVLVSASTRRLGTGRQLQNTVDIQYTASVPKSRAASLVPLATAAEMQTVFATEVSTLESTTGSTYGTVVETSLETLATSLQSTIAAAVAAATSPPTPPPTVSATPAPPTAASEPAASGAFRQSISCILVAGCLAFLQN